MLLNSLGRSVPIPNRRREKLQSNRFAIFYGLALTGFLCFVLGQAAGAFVDYPIEILLLFIIGGLSIYGQLLSIRREAPIHFVSFLFSFLFMSAAPIAQLNANIDPVFQIAYWVLLAAVNAFVFTAIGVFFTHRLKNPDGATPPKPIATPSGYLLVFLASAVTSVTAIVLFKDSLFTDRETFGSALGGLFEDAPTAALVLTILTSTPFYGAVIGLRSSIANRQKMWVAMFSVIMLMAAILNNPLINARFKLAGLAFFFIDYMFYGKRTKLLAVLLIVGVLFAPAFQAFRTNEFSFSRNTEFGEISQYNKLGDTSRYDDVSKALLSMDYDSFQVSCYTMLMVDNAGISWGSNILGALLFFVPRTWWPEKPPPSSWVIYGTMIGYREVGTNNLSTPLIAEGYYAFGWAGALVISFLYWWGSSRITVLSQKDLDSSMFLLRCVFVGLVLIILRGTLLIGVAAVVGSFLAATIPAFLIKSGVKRRGRLYLLAKKPFRKGLSG
jgi:NADH:ubiquinone oxidoreductase subunit 6 (subunit J)